MYRCIADNDVRPPAMHDATLLVFFKPVARAVQDSYGQAQNRRFHLTMECRIAGRQREKHSPSVLPNATSLTVLSHQILVRPRTWPGMFK